jgi:hypothetical protein
VAYIRLANIILILTLCCCSCFQLQAQSNSPYSRYGIGDMLDEDNIENRAMGGLSIANDASKRINTINPASLSNLKLSTLTFGLLGSTNRISSSKGVTTVGSFNISNFAIGVPIIKNNFGMAFGLQPFSRVNYLMQSTSVNPQDTGSKQFQDFAGSGGTQQAFLAGGYRYKNFSFGARTSFVFGSLVNKSTVSFPDSLNSLAVQYLNGRYVKGVQFNVGTMYYAKLPKGQTLTLGATFTPATSLNSIRDYRYITPLVDNSTGQIFDDTVTSTVDQKGKVILPAQWGVGVALSKDALWRAGIDIQGADWTKYSSYGEQDSLGNSYKVRVGGSYMPSGGTYNKSYWSNVEYRGGFYFGNDIYKLRGKQIKTQAVSLGLGLPFKSGAGNFFAGTLNLGLQLGSRGTIDNGLLRDGFTRYTIGFTVNDATWFRKRRYD